jgi:hypothetical protein
MARLKASLAASAAGGSGIKKRISEKRNGVTATSAKSKRQ